jgi:hypothetical protein
MMFFFKLLFISCFIIDSFEKIYIFREGDAVLIKCHHLIQAVRTYGKDFNLVHS